MTCFLKACILANLLLKKLDFLIPWKKKTLFFIRIALLLRDLQFLIADNVNEALEDIQKYDFKYIYREL